MQVLQWVLDDPDQIERAVLVAATSQLTAENMAFSTVAREAIMSDPDFHGGAMPTSAPCRAAGSRSPG